MIAETTFAETIAAVATPPGQGGIGIVRLSGPAAKDIGEKICRISLTPRTAHSVKFFEDKANQPLDSGIALYFKQPASFTGEDIVELQGHGSPVVLGLLLRACCKAGARLARPGEFSERAFLKGKIDLAQAEAIADLIGSTTEAAARGAAKSLQGAFSKKINSLVKEITALRVYVEAAIDFPEEEVDFITDGEVAAKLESLLSRIGEIFAIAKQGRVLRDGIKAVIAGPPNAGKSSLLNALCGQDTAIVTAVEGTTRDVLREHIEIDGVPLHLSDTAGLRESKNEVELEGIRRAWEEIKCADRILVVIDAHQSPRLTATARKYWQMLHEYMPDAIPMTLIRNKCDLLKEASSIKELEEDTIITLSAKTGEGIDLLKQHLKHAVGLDGPSYSPFVARRRHLDALEQTRGCLQSGQNHLQQSKAAELLAEDLRQAHQYIGEITGAVSSDELLGKIFTEFCIGK